MGIVDLLAAPLRALVDAFGSGRIDAAGVDAAIAAVEKTLTDVTSRTQASNVTLAAGWLGVDSDTAQRVVGKAGVTATELSQTLTKVRSSAQTAAAVVARGHASLTKILDSFVAQGNAASPTLANPAGLIAVLALAASHLQQALDVLRSVRSELDAQKSTVAGLSKTVPSAPTAPTPVAASTAGKSAPTGTSSPLSSLGSLSSQLASAVTSPLSALSGVASTAGSGLDGLSSLASTATPDTSTDTTNPTSTPTPTSDTTDSAAAKDVIQHASTTTGGVAVTLPDGSVVTAPNAAAAAAVRAALTQRGVPYVWGGTTPGQGLDCSGLTQWAYRQAGLELPRIAADQDIGAQVSSDALLPGDLAVWDGHVAMIIGNGQMIEAGSPVSISPIRTDNIGQGFQGFWRPTAAQTVA